MVGAEILAVAYICAQTEGRDCADRKSDARLEKLSGKLGSLRVSKKIETNELAVMVVLFARGESKVQRAASPSSWGIHHQYKAFHGGRDALVLLAEQEGRRLDARWAHKTEAEDTCMDRGLVENRVTCDSEDDSGPYGSHVDQIRREALDLIPLESDLGHETRSL